jgi:Icc-related predicted phosphoesterase
VTTPDPLETVTILMSDFEMLQAAANAGMEDYVNLCTILGINPATDRAPREVVHEVIYPMLRALVATSQKVAEAHVQIGQAAARHGNQVIEMPNGQKGILVGKKDPKLAQRLRGRR